MHYITISDLSKTIRANFYKIPHDVDVVMGIPRSGMICASIISTLLNRPLIDMNSFCEGAHPSGGGRLRFIKDMKVDETKKKKVLVVDDTVFTGISKQEARNKLKPFENENEFIFLAVYLEGPAIGTVDIWLEDVRMYTNNYKDAVLYEWNIFHHNESTMESCIYDIDGVFCVEPPDERSGVPYDDYIKNAIPLFTPTPVIGAIMTFRLNKNREVTEEWLKKNNIKYRQLIMFNANSWEERNATGISPELMKGNYYRDSDWAKLFVESDDHQAQVIHAISKKPVYCVESNKMYAI